MGIAEHSSFRVIGKFNCGKCHLISIMAKCAKLLLLAAVCLIGVQASQVPRRQLEETSDKLDMVKKGMDEVTEGVKQAAKGVESEIEGMLGMEEGALLDMAPGMVKKDGDTETAETHTGDDTGGDDDTAMTADSTEEGRRLLKENKEEKDETESEDCYELGEKCTYEATGAIIKQCCNEPTVGCKPDDDPPLPYGGSGICTTRPKE